MVIGSLVFTSVGCDQSLVVSDEAETVFRVAPMTDSEIHGALANAHDSDIAVVFVNMGWSVTSVLGVPKYAQLVMDYYSQRPKSDLLFHIVDCTNLSHDSEIFRDFPDLFEIGSGFFGGYGELYWFREGRLVHVESIAQIEFLADFIAKTDAVMQ